MKSRGSVGTDKNARRQLPPARLVPNNETIAAIWAARRGEFDGSFGNVEDFLQALHADDRAAE
jgi:hypothetical protein